MATDSRSATEPDVLTVDGLISRLQNYHGATPVLVEGYEDGFDEIGFRLFSVKRKKHEVWWGGRYQEDKNGLEVLVLQRTKP